MPVEDSSVLSSGNFGRISRNLFIILFQLKKLFSRAKMKEKDKKTGILKNAPLNNLFQFLVLVGFPL